MAEFGKTIEVSNSEQGRQGGRKYVGARGRHSWNLLAPGEGERGHLIKHMFQLGYRDRRAGFSPCFAAASANENSSGRHRSARSHSGRPGGGWELEVALCKP